VTTRPARTRSWERVSTLIALSSLLAAIVFSALQTGASTDQQRLARQALQLQLYTELDERAQRSARILFSKGFLAKSDLRKIDTMRSDFLRVLGNLEYLAYLFNRRFIELPGVRQRWLSNMTCAWLLMEQKVEPEVQPWYPELEKITRDGACVGPSGALRRKK
jgi:hypothetical protein